jgi:ketosteroid isomerase-like protein
MSSEPEIRALAKRFFDAVENGDIDTVFATYAPEAKIWHNTDGAEPTRDDNAATLKGFVRHISNRVYDERRLSVFDGGFVHQHRLRGTRPDGAAVALDACIVCAVENGRITRLDEYFDSAQVAEFTGTART